ncbi:hypothetical protein JJJA_0054 [Achromobacter phage JWDelta]|uniref:Uncharacterized protein n=1 Tax=Achromobacter phage JWDelta TaxID=1416008 RepID=V9SKA6_9CAUD|nr:hypothetical protein JJJA_0054 [Achromobacter phage JWDelta]
MTKKTDTNAANTPVKKHHWLFAAQVVFHVAKEGQPATDGGALLLNGLVLTDDKQIAMADLARAQMTAVSNLNERFKGQNVEVIDCVFMSFSHLGFMSQPEYAKTPEGQALIKTEVPVNPAERPEAKLTLVKPEGDPVSGD